MGGKLFSMREEFETIVVGFTRSLLSLWGIMFVLIVINYGCTLFCFSVIGKHNYTEYTDYDHDLYWGNIPRTMMTMFSMMITDAWGTYARTIWEEQPPVILFFYIYTVLLTWGLLNVVTGMIVDTVNRVRQDAVRMKSERKMDAIKKRLSVVVGVAFSDADDHEITEEEFLMHADKEELLGILEVVDVPATFNMRDFFILLDGLGQKQMTKEHFIEAIHMLANGTVFHRDCQLLLSTHKIRGGFVGLRQELRTLHHRVWMMAESPPIDKAPPNKLMPLTIPRRPDRTRPLPLELPSEDQGPWGQWRAVLRNAAMQHAEEELHKRWEELEWEFKSMDPVSRRKFCVMPSMSGRAKGSSFAELQEQYFIWNKLLNAILCESLFDLREALDHATSAGISQTSRAIIFTYCDAS